jgi:hypothetical protein
MKIIILFPKRVNRKVIRIFMDIIIQMKYFQVAQEIYAHLVGQFPIKKISII